MRLPDIGVRNLRHARSSKILLQRAAILEIGNSKPTLSSREILTAGILTTKSYKEPQSGTNLSLRSLGVEEDIQQVCD